MGDWPPRSENGLHGATYEWDCTIGAAPLTAVRCICGFYRITDTHDRAEMEYMHHIPLLDALQDAEDPGMHHESERTTRNES